MPYKDPQKLKENKKRYYQEHRTELIEKATIWNKSHKYERKDISKRDNDKRKLKKRIWHENKYFGGVTTIIGVGKCAECGKKKALVIHHIDRDKENNEPMNHYIICKSCHAKIHKGAK